jgi:capsule polysaccharide export protein KpsE/RkpR
VGVSALLLGFGLPLRTAGQADTNSPFPELKKQQEQLTLENGIAEQQLRKELSRLTAEKQRLELENNLAQQKLQAAVASLQAEIDKLNKQADLVNKRLALKEAER